MVSYSENIDDYFTAMGTEQSLLWMARAFDERVSFWNTNGDRTFHTKLSWKFCKYTVINPTIYCSIGKLKERLG